MHGTLVREATASPSTLWRVGGKALRTIWVHPSGDREDPGVMVGMMETPELAEQVVEAINGRRG